MLGSRLHDLTPLRIPIDLIDFLERLVDIGNRRYERRTCADCAAACLPVEWVSPAVVIIAGALGFLEDLKEMDGLTIVLMPARKPARGKRIP